MKSILTLGESLLRFSTQKGNRLSNATSLSLHYGGAEANVAMNLSRLNHKVKYATKLPLNNGLADSLVNQLQGSGVDCSNIIYSEGRLGSYYVEVGSGLRPSNIIYDRNHSAIAMMNDLEWNLDQLFEDISVFHITGITLALSKKWSEMGLTLIKEAKRRNIKVSFDINYREKMWSKNEAKEILMKVLPYIDYLSAGKLDAIHFMDIPEVKEVGWNYYSEKISEKYPNIKYIYGTTRTSLTPNSFEMTGHVLDTVTSKESISKVYKNYTVVDRVGSGDSFAAAILDGILLNKSVEDIVEFAMAASALKHTVHGDANPFKRKEINDFLTNTTNDVLR